MKSVLEQATKLCVPTKEEQASVDKIIAEVQKKVDVALKKSNITATCRVGGSVAKGTWLAGVSDIDFFILFDYKKYNRRHMIISDMAELALLQAFKFVTRLHGSRDYFNITYKNYILEFVPVLEISSLSDALNLTDYSPLHVYWVRDRINANKKLQTEVRLAKQFFKAAGVYGAESYIAGFSGHIIEILTIYYGGFLRFLKNAVNWKNGDIIDINKAYKSRNKVLGAINESKLQSPIIVIDPVEPTRNAAAALGEEKFSLLKKTAKKFLANPSAEFFKTKQFDINSLKQKKNQKLFVLQASPAEGKEDVIGSRFVKQFEMLKSGISKLDFEILDSGWHWAGEGPAVFWIYLPARPLPKEKVIAGPPAGMPNKFIAQFRKKWKRIFLKNKRYWVKIERKVVRPQDVIKIAASALKLKLLTK